MTRRALSSVALGLGLSLLAGSLLPGCGGSLRFRGESQFPGGPRGCYRQCQAYNMEMDSFVYLGTYSSGCVCRRRLVQPGSARADRQGHHGGAAASASSAVAVMVRLQEEEDERRRQEAARRWRQTNLGQP